MKSSVPVVESPLHRAPCESVLAAESPQRFEIGDLDHLRRLGIKVEMQKAGRRSGARHVGERSPGRIDELVFVLMNIRREQEELLVFDGEPSRWLADPTLAQDDDVAAFTEFPTDHRPLFQRDIIHGEHRD